MIDRIQEVIFWLKEKQKESMKALRDEPCKKDNHLATAYRAEVQLCAELLEFIEGQT